MKTLLPLVLLSLLLQACAPNPHKPTAAYQPVQPPPQPQRVYAGGSLWQAGYNQPLFEDGRAHQVGDVLTIKLQEQTSAIKKQDTTTSRKTDVNVSNPVFFGKPSMHGSNPFMTNTLASDNSFAGAGESKQSNNLSGTITATVTRVLPNGLLEIRGQKWLQINQGHEYIQVSGLVRTLDIEPDNTVSSTRIANAQIAYTGKGTLADANRQGWLARFFNSVIWPF